MFENQPLAPVPPNNFPQGSEATPPNTKTPPPVANPAMAEPEDIFGKVDPIPAAPATQEPMIKSAPSIFTAPIIPKTEPNNPQLNLADLAASPKTLDAKSIVLLVIIGLIIIGTAAAAFWWFAKNKKNNLANSPAINLFNDLANSNSAPTINESINNAVDNINNNESVNAGGLPPANPDTDGDGLLDEEEISLGTSLDAIDTDSDGLSDREEIKVYKTDPLKSDTDGDGLGDGDEIKNNKDPRLADAITKDGFYTDISYKFSFTPLPGMVLASANDELVLFNDDTRQIKFYIYLNNSQPQDLQAPDFAYIIAANPEGSVIIKSNEQLADKTPVSSEYSTQNYEAANGFSYTIRYVATQRGLDHKANFETLLSSFKFIKQ